MPASETQDPETVRINNLAFSYERNAAPVLAIPAWRVAAGERVFLYGESGSGKSTLLHLLAGLQVPQSGSLSVLGTDVAGLSVRQRDQFRAKHIGVVFQQFNLIPYLSVLDNILLAAKFGTAHAATARDRALELLAAVNLELSLAARRADRLSIGQQQRVSIVRALVNSPELLLVDEPTSALDTVNRDAFLDLLFEVLDASGCAMVFVSHDPLIAERFESKIALADLVSGRTSS